MPFPELNTTGFFFEQVAFKAPRLRANYGDGYTAGARLSSNDLKAWRLTIAALPDRANWLVEAQTRARYLYEFWFDVKLVQNSEVFKLRDPGLPRDPGAPFVFARFAEDSLDLGQMCADVFSVQLTIMEARVAGEDPNA